MPLIIALIVVVVIGATLVVVNKEEPVSDPVSETNNAPGEELPDVRPASDEDTAMEEGTEMEDSMMEEATDNPEPVMSDPDPVPEEVEVSTVYKDGTYTASASYFTPKRQEHDLDITLTVANDVVTEATITYDDGPAKTGSHKGFDGAYETEVIGVELSNIDLSRVGGASLTSDAYNNALAEIKSDAKNS